MKIVSLRCPNCGANQDINSDLRVYICNYCGTNFYLENNKVTEEENKSKKKKKSDEEIVSKVKDVLIKEVKITNFKKELKDINFRISIIRKNIDEENSILSIIRRLLIPAFFALIAWSCILGKMKSSVIVILFALVIISTYLGNLVHKFKLNKLNNELNDNNNKIKELNNSIISIQNQIDYSILPPDYRNLYAINIIYKALKNEKAKNINQAIQIYEEQAEKDRIYALKLDEMEMKMESIARQDQIKEQELRLKEQELILKEQNYKNQYELQKQQVEQQEIINKINKRRADIETVVAAGTLISATTKLLKTIKKFK